MHPVLSEVKGMLIDVDGVLYNDGIPVPGAPETIDFLRERGIPFRLITNTTMRSRNTLWKRLSSIGFRLEEREIFTAVRAAVEYLRSVGAKRYFPLITDDAKKEFSDFREDQDSPDFVVVGDMGEAWTFQLLNQGFRALMAGADLLALQKNRFWMSQKGLQLDAGPFVAALEYASDKKAILVGKPNRAFFEMALQDMGLKPQDVVMIGDDIESDIVGAQRLGMKTILVKTGKFMPRDLKKGVKPDIVLDSIADLMK